MTQANRRCFPKPRQHRQDKKWKKVREAKKRLSSQLKEITMEKEELLKEREEWTKEKFNMNIQLNSLKQSSMNL